MESKEGKKLTFKDFSLEKIILIALAGIILIVTNLPTSKKEKTLPAVTEEKTNMQTDDEYIEMMEGKLERILGCTKGVGKVEVMITLKSSKENVLNKDTSRESQLEKEQSDEVTRSSTLSKDAEETILADASGQSAPYVIKELSPEIKGIVISCEGAENKEIVAAVTEATQALFGVASNHIKVLIYSRQED